MGTNSMCGDVDRWSEEVLQRSAVGRGAVAGGAVTGVA